MWPANNTIMQERFTNGIETVKNRSLLLQSSKNYKKTMNFYINKQKQSNAKRLRDIHSSRPNEYWDNTKLPPLKAFYTYFKEIKRSSCDGKLDSESSNFNISESDDILNVPITKV